VESTNADLVARVRTGDVDAFEVLYRRHASRIDALACRMSGSPEAGEDLRTFSGDIVIAKGK